MKIVIDIPEDEYEAICYNVLNGREHSYGYVAIANGTPYEERKTGKWEYCNLFRICSECRCVTGEKDDFNDWLPDKYCPNCGAKMEVDE